MKAMRGLRLVLVVVVLVLGLLIAPDRPCAAQSGSLSTKAYSGYAPLQIQYHLDPNQTQLKMDITISTLGKPSPQDRNLEVVFQINNWGEPAIAYRKFLRLPQGATSVSHSFFHCISRNGRANWLLDVREDGESILWPPPSVSAIGQVQQSGQHQYCLIIPNGLGKKRSFPFDDYFTAGDLAGEHIPIRDAPTDWRFYLNYSFAVWHADLLDAASDSQREALSMFLLSGGIGLIAFSDPESLQPENLLRLDRALAPGMSLDKADYRWRPWTASDGAVDFQRSHGGGRLIALCESPTNLGSRLSSLAFHYPIADMVVNEQAEEKWFWRNLVQSVGRTPVWTFSVMVFLFVLLVGPGLLIFTRQLRHRTLMLFLVPAVSGLLTLCVLLYNGLRERNVTRGRIVSVQFFDTHTDLGAVWSRQSYFCGTPSEAGLSFSREAFLKPVVISDFRPDWSDSQQRQNVFAEIVSESDAQTLRRWLLPRSQQQVLVGQKLTRSELPIRLDAISDSRVQLTNQSEQNLPLVVLKGSQDGFFFATDLPSGQSVSLDSIPQTVLESLLQQHSSLWEIQVPAEIDLLSTRRRSSRRYSWGVPSQQILTDPMNSLINPVNLVGKLPPMGYLIVTSDCASLETPFPREVFESDRNLHVLIGANPW
jgi:hypothetical protein